MKNKISKSILLLGSLVLVVCFALGGTVAFLVAQSDPVENVFTPAKVTTYVDEKIDGNVKSNVKIENTGNTDAYIRAAIVVTWKNDEGYIYPKAPVLGSDYTMTFGSDWQKIGDYYYYKSVVPAKGKTTDLIVSCSPVDGKAPTDYYLSVEILGSGVQATKEAVTEAWGADIASQLGLN